MGHVEGSAGEGRGRRRRYGAHCEGFGKGISWEEKVLSKRGEGDKAFGEGVYASYRFHRSRIRHMLCETIESDNLMCQV